MEEYHVRENPERWKLVPINQAMKKSNLGLCLQFKLSTIDSTFSENVPLMQAGVTGHLTGAHAVPTVGRGKSQFHRSPGTERAFRKCMEAGIAPYLRKKPEGTSSPYTRKNEPALTFQIVQGLQPWDPGENGPAVLKHAFLWITPCLKLKETDTVRKQSSQQMKR